MQQLFVFCLVILSEISGAQTGVIHGVISDKKNGQPLSFANIVIRGTTTGTTSDINGNYELKNLEPGLFSLSATYLGYLPEEISEILVTNNNPAIINFNLTTASQTIQDVVIQTSPFEENNESPVSLRTLGIAEIERNPGGNRDLSRVLQSLPGVAPGVSYRNDLIIRGGSPSENRFYLEDIETPNINHFATQGASGGPVGMIDVNYVREVNFYSGAFPAQASNALSSVLKVNFKEPRDDRFGIRATFGATDFGVAAEGPVSDKSGFFLSARRSYLNVLFKAIGLPFLPTYHDVQYKFKFKPNDKNEFYTLMLAAYDFIILNTDANETAEQRYILRYIPTNTQWNYTNGFVWKHFHEKGYSTFVYSRNLLDFSAEKFEDNLETDSNRILNYTSRETEDKIRIETQQYFSAFKLNAGVNYEYASYSTNTFNRITSLTGPITLNYDSYLSMNKFGAWAQLRGSLMKDKFSWGACVRTDANDYNQQMKNPLNQISPRVSVSYHLTPALNLNANSGIYYQIPAYPTLGYRNDAGKLINEDKLNYIRAIHYVAGLSYNSAFNSRISVEGFLKQYDNYPFNLNDSVTLANMGSDFGVVGNAPVDSRGEGRAYGLEFLYQQKMFKGFYGILSYTFLRSEFTNGDQTFVPSSWDSRHILSLTGGKQFKRNWEAGFRFRFASGNPYTPIDQKQSSLIYNFNVNPRGQLEYSLVNSQRLNAFHNLDFRIDKKFFLKKVSLNFYLDIQNVYNFQIPAPPILLAKEDANGNPLIDPNDPTRFQTSVVEYSSGTIVPSLGFILEY